MQSMLTKFTSVRMSTMSLNQKDKTQPDQMATESSNKDSKGNGSDSEAILEDMKQLDLEKKSLDDIDDPKPTSNANQEANPDLDPSKPQEPESVANVVLKPTVIE